MASTLVLDLDDTLYPEADYVASGVRHVARTLADLYRVDAEAALLEDAANGDDWLASACEMAGLPGAAKDSLLWLYRLHEPTISLSAETRTALDLLRAKCRTLVILTDGRGVTQRLKLAALGLADLPVYVSEEWASEKPDVLRFKRIMSEYGADRYLYVGDNPAKDFIGPNQLGWVTLGIRLGSSALYSSQQRELPPECAPAQWIDSLSEVVAFV